MPYSNAEEAKQAARERMRRIRENKRENEKQGEQPKTVGRTGVKPEGEQPADVTPLDPLDWADRRNYTEAYLRCLEEQGSELTEASKVAMKGHKVEDGGWCRRHSINSEVRPAREMTGEEKREKLGKVCQALDREISTLDGQKVNLQGMVRFGVEGPTIDVVSQWIRGR